MNCITDCDKAISINPTLTKAIKKKASALAYMLKFSEAVSVLKLAYANEKDNKALKN